VLLHGHSGTGKTLLARAVAASTNSTFIQVVGSELVQKFIGEGAKLVKEMFQLARERSPSVVFIDELDALAATRMDLGTSGEREVQRTFMQLLSEIDGFKPLGDVKIIGCTNRKDVLDPAVVRPGRLDRLIEVPLPDSEARDEIFKIHTRNMRLHKDVKAGDVITNMDGFTGAEIKAAVTEAGYFAIRANRTTAKHSDFMQAINKVKQEEKHDKGHLRMFG
jgi:proteasome regulatory subunit